MPSSHLALKSWKVKFLKLSYFSSHSSLSVFHVLMNGTIQIRTLQAQSSYCFSLYSNPTGHQVPTILPLWHVSDLPIPSIPTAISSVQTPNICFLTEVPFFWCLLPPTFYTTTAIIIFIKHTFDHVIPLLRTLHIWSLLQTLMSAPSHITCSLQLPPSVILCAPAIPECQQCSQTVWRDTVLCAWNDILIPQQAPTYPSSSH